MKIIGGLGEELLGTKLDVIFMRLLPLTLLACLCVRENT